MVVLWSDGARSRLDGHPHSSITLEQGLHLGYRRRTTGGSWIARRRNDEGIYREAKLGLADDLQDARPRIWGFADELYLPLFQFARMHRLPMLALNIDRATNRRIAAQGLASVPSSEREGVGDPAPASSFYRDRLFEWFKKHPAAGQDARAALERFERFVCAQQFWDRAMAEAIAGARRDARQPLVVGIMGSGHIEYGDGVPYQLAALGVDNVATALPWPAETEYPIHAPPIADFLFGVEPAPA